MFINNKQAFFVNYDGIMVPFWELENGVLDRCIKSGMPIGTDRFLYERLFLPGDLCYDIGSYIGTHAIQMALLGGRVAALEPSPFNYNRCAYHCSLFRQISVYNVGLHEKTYNVLTKFKDCNGETDPEQQIQYYLFDDFVKQHGLQLPDFVKMDIEGMETTVLKTMSSLILDKKTTFLIEIHPAKRGDNSSRYKDNPHFLWPEDGGFDFDFFIENVYNVYNTNDGQNKLEQTFEPNIHPDGFGAKIAVHSSKDRIKELIKH